MRIVFMGSGDIGLPSLRYLLSRSDCKVVACVTQPDKPAGRKLELLAPATKTLALEHGVPVLQPRKIRSPKSVAALTALQADVFVVMAYGQLLPPSVLGLPRLACLNLHASLLPLYRGAAPIQAAILAGDTESGVTVMHMAEGMDTGDIFLAHRLPLLPDETGGSLHDRLADLAPAALGEALDLLEKGEIIRIPQDHTQATHVTKLSREDGVLDWRESAQALERRVRAFDPWPGTSTVLNGRKLKVWTVSVVKVASGSGALPGSVLETGASGIVVACGSGALALTSVQLEGRKRMSARDFLLGSPLPIGTVFSLPGVQ